MLNRAQLAVKLERVIADIFVEVGEEYVWAQELWKTLANDPLLAAKLAAARVSWLLPTWQGGIDVRGSVVVPATPYDIIAVDGSQIYPDRHSGVSCYLVNIGEAIFQYELEKPVTFISQPYVFSGNDQEAVDISVEYINGQRQELELQGGYVRARALVNGSRPHLLVFDGSLIFWHLEAKDPVLKEIFLSRYLHIFLRMYEAKIVFASYISAPKSRELVNIVKTYAADFDERNQAAITALAHMHDAMLLKGILAPAQRTTIFKNHATISELYPAAVHPHFFYIHTGFEVGRVEIPAWIAEDTHLVDWVASAIYDQCAKGYGYPVALAEAHNQAVVKGPDRDFFYHLIHKLSIDRKRIIDVSQKVMKKRGMGI
jgi:hypothetical protein